ncbi:Uncharacterised protein [BD1-7 clade bacterium]|uniref:Porin domain-containing protein n=1 Tax=BD1-7 clade bacterium TaxID=2029982 RepID=A0A5S9Q695_9GAMM|nr:Uncharacterised protein [BD1-7 clade bacterium]CAA0113355.1 Uncharacterised protein [BD1-7 clade bacterium]
MIRQMLMAAGVFASAGANAYTFEATYDYSQANFDSTFTIKDSSLSDFLDSRGIEIDAPKIDIATHSVDAQIYFSDVDISKGAWNDAAFLNQASSFRGGYIGQKIESDQDDVDATEIDGFYIGGRGVAGGFIYDGEYKSQKFDDDNQRTLGFGFGGYITENHSLVGSFEDTRGDDIDFFLIGLTYQGYLPLGNTGHALGFMGQIKTGSGEAHSNFQDFSRTNLNAKVSYYPMPQLAVGAEVGSEATVLSANDKASKSESTISQFGVFADYYVVENFRIGVDVGSDKRETESNLITIESESVYYGVNLRARF